MAGRRHGRGGVGWGMLRAAELASAGMWPPALARPQRGWVGDAGGC